MTSYSPRIIDMREPANDIRKEYGRQLHHDPGAVDKLALLWGFKDKNNRHGVLTDYTTETLLQVKRCRADIYFAESSKGHWLIGTNACTSIGGYCYAPSVFHDTGYPSYQDARLAGILEIEKFFIRELKSTGNTHTAREEARAALKTLEQEKQPKLDLFDQPLVEGGARGR